ncbi:hypothetical protein Sjap_000131 [Stephania japonica]|uniref:O-methyltransferase C-terminal domain-containing protein n=1 Tax=Stephania japonica TaxID=461633 RepID=A0AAP0PTQ8_9MAGN
MAVRSPSPRSSNPSTTPHPPPRRHVSRPRHALARLPTCLTATSPGAGCEVQYGLTRASKWLLREAKLSLAPFALLETHPVMMTPWHYLSRSVEVGGEPFEMAYGTNCCDYAFVDREYDKIFNAGMECTAKIVMKMVLNGYKSGFDGLGTVVEVGGGTGMFIREIVMANPGLKGVLLNVPHVVASAPDHPDVVKIGGDMFVEVPQGDAVNCRKAIPESGKVVIVDAVVHPEKEGLFEFTRVGRLTVQAFFHTAMEAEMDDLECQAYGSSLFKILVSPITLKFDSTIWESGVVFLIDEDIEATMLTPN